MLGLSWICSVFVLLWTTGQQRLVGKKEVVGIRLFGNGASFFY